MREVEKFRESAIGVKSRCFGDEIEDQGEEELKTFVELFKLLRSKLSSGRES